MRACQIFRSPGQDFPKDRKSYRLKLKVYKDVKNILNISGNAAKRT